MSGFLDRRTKISPKTFIPKQQEESTKNDIVDFNGYTNKISPSCNDVPRANESPFKENTPSTTESEKLNTSNDEESDETENEQGIEITEQKKETVDIHAFKLLPPPPPSLPSLSNHSSTANEIKKHLLIFRRFFSNLAAIIQNLRNSKQVISKESPQTHKYPYQRSNTKCQAKANVWKIYTLIFVVFASFLLNFLKNSSNNHSQLHPKHQQTNGVIQIKESFDINVNALKEKYPNQTNSFWANIESSFEYSIIGAGAPSIILLVNDKLTNRLADQLTTDLFECFLKILKTSPNNWKDDLVISPLNDAELLNLISNGKYDMTKKYVDNRLDKIFLNGNKFALVRNIEKLPATTMLLFYTYGDDLTNAKYPGIVILMCLELDDVFIESSKRSQLLKSGAQLSEFVENYLYDLWSTNIHEDQLRPLFTRIANNVIFINNENSNKK